MTFYPGATDVAGAMLLQVAAGAEASGTVIRWQRADTVRIKGKVVGAAAGNPALVQLSPKGVLDSTLAAWQPRTRPPKVPTERSSSRAQRPGPTC